MPMVMVVRRAWAGLTATANAASAAAAKANLRWVIWNLRTSEP